MLSTVNLLVIKVAKLYTKTFPGEKREAVVVCCFLEWGQPRGFMFCSGFKMLSGSVVYRQLLRKGISGS